MSAQSEPSDDMTDEATIPVGETADGEAYTLPVEEVLTGRAFVTGKSGSGKSNTGSVVAEELLERGHPLLVVDVDGEYWGLKEEYELLHVGATEECDLQVGPEHAGKLAELALDQHVPIVLDVSGYADGATADDLVREVAHELFAREQQAMQPFLLLVEEIHEFLPQQGGLDETGEMLIRVAKRGRKRGLGIMGLSQRPANVRKDFITQADLLVWHRLTWDNDTDVVSRVVGSDYADRVAGLADGEAFVQADWHEADIERVQFRRKHTFDAGATPGLDDVERPELKSIGESLVDELTEISEQHDQRQDRIAELEQRLEEKDERIEELKQERDQARDVGNAAQQLAEALQQGEGGEGEGAVPADFEEQLAEKNETIAGLRERVESLEADLADVQDERDDLQSEVERLQGVEARVEQAEEIEQRWDDVEEWIATAPPAVRELAADVDGFFDEVGAREQEEAGASPDRDAEAVDEALRAELAEKESRIDELEERLANAGEPAVPTDYEDFLEDDVVQEALAEAKQEEYPSEKYHKGVVATILTEQGPVTYEEVADRLGVSRTNEVSSAATTLESYGVIEKEQTDDGVVVDLNVDGIREIKAAKRKRERTGEVMEQL